MSKNSKFSPLPLKPKTKEKMLEPPFPTSENTPPEPKSEENSILPSYTPTLDPKTPAEEIVALKKIIDEKDKESIEIYAMIQEAKTSFEKQRNELDNYKDQIETLKTSLTMKENLITTLKGTIGAKEEQIAMKEQQMRVYQQTIETKNRDLQSIQATSDSKYEKIIEEKDKEIKHLIAQIKTLGEETTLLKADIDDADKEVEELTQKFQKIENEARDGIYLNREKIIARMKEILNESLHNVLLCVPTLDDLIAIDIYNVKSSVQLKIICHIDSTNQKQLELAQELQSLGNLNLRNYDGKDRWTLLKDNEILFMVISGSDPNKFLSFYTTDPLHIKFFNSLAMESWLRGRKI